MLSGGRFLPADLTTLEGLNASYVTKDMLHDNKVFQYVCRFAVVEVSCDWCLTGNSSSQILRAQLGARTLLGAFLLY